MPLLNRSEEMVLLAVIKLGDNASGMTIRRYLSEISGEDLAIATIYRPLDRLKAKGFVTAIDAPPTKERGGRRRRLYQPTRAGLAALEHLRQVHAELWSGFSNVAFS